MTAAARAARAAAVSRPGKGTAQLPCPLRPRAKARLPPMASRGRVPEGASASNSGSAARRNRQPAVR